MEEISEVKYEEDTQVLPVPMSGSDMDSAVNTTTGKQLETGPVSGIPADIKFLKGLTYGILVVMFIGFMAMFVATLSIWRDSWSDKNASYQDLINKIDERDSKIDLLNLEIELLTNEVRRDKSQQTTR